MWVCTCVYVSPLSWAAWMCTRVYMTSLSDVSVYTCLSGSTEQYEGAHVFMWLHWAEQCVCVRMCLCGSRSLCSSLKLYFPSRPTGLTSEQGEPGEMRVLCGAETTDTGLQLRGHHRQFFRRLSGKTPLINLRADVQGLRDKHFLNFPCTYPSEIQFSMCPLKTIFYLLGV